METRWRGSERKEGRMSQMAGQDDSQQKGMARDETRRGEEKKRWNENRREEIVREMIRWRWAAAEKR
jgi:hypothetical protein